MGYTNIADVAAELGGVTINGSSTPTASQVQSWIEDATKEVEEITGRVWASTSVTSDSYEYIDYDGSGRMRLKKTPIISVDSVEYDSEGLGAASTTWSTLTEGRTTSEDFIVYPEEGLIVLHASSTSRQLSSGKRNVRVTYTHGYNIVPRHIKRLTTLMVARRYIATVANKTGSDEGGSVSVGTISVSDPNNYVHNHLRQVQSDLDYYLEKVATQFKSHIYDIEVYD